jgi:hypothetical protein
MSCVERSLIDRHFALDARLADQSVLRAHLDGCADCRGYYDRHLLLAQLDPAAPSLEDRLAASLGFSRRRRAVPLTIALTLATLSAAAILLFATRGREAEFAARGGGSAPGPALQIYCTSCGKPAPRLGETVPASASLAFTYQNPGGRKRLMVLAVDEGRKVYWFHPDPQASPVAVAIESSAAPRELPVEIDQAFVGRTVRILGLFSDEPLPVAKVEGLVDASGCASLRALAATCVEQRVAVAREKPR